MNLQRPQLVTMEGERPDGDMMYGGVGFLMGQPVYVQRRILNELEMMGFDSIEDADYYMHGRFGDWLKSKARKIRDVVRKRREGRARSQAEQQFYQEQMQQQAQRSQRGGGLDDMLKNPIVPIAIGGLLLIMLMK